MDVESLKRIAKLKKRIKELENGITDIVDNRLKGYSDKQYGKGELKELLKKKRTVI